MGRKGAWAFGIAVGLLSWGAMERSRYAQEADERVLYAARMGRGGPIISAEATGSAKRHLYVAMVDCGRFPDAEARILLSRRGFTVVTCDDAEGPRITGIGDAPALAVIFDP